MSAVSCEAFVFVGLDEHALAAGVVDDVLISDPVGHGDDDFVAVGLMSACMRLKMACLPPTVTMHSPGA